MPAETILEEETVMEETSDLDPKLKAKLDLLSPGAYCRHRSWGVGKIASKDDTLASLTIDFRSKKGHSMEFVYAAESLRPLGKDHFEARILREVEVMRELSAKDPGAFMVLAVTSLEKEATGARIEEAVVPHLFKADGWKKFWEAAKRAMRKDLRFVIPGKRSDAIQYLETAPDAKAGGLTDLQEAVGAKRVIEALEKLQKARNSAELKAITDEAFKLV
ncbi:hypothetical protein EBY67_03670, partial [bacterium]|nr:hypothetical protein [bacterium]